MSPKIAIVCCGFGILVGVGAMWLARPGDAAREAGSAERSARAEHARPILIENRTGARAEEIRTLVAEEVRAALREHAASAAPAGEVPAGAAGHEAPEPSPAFEQAKGQVAERVAQGTWTASDRDWMRGALGTVHDAERRELVRPVLVAANSGALRVEVMGPLF